MGPCGMMLREIAHAVRDLGALPSNFYERAE
jgi:hypothetical protein